MEVAPFFVDFHHFLSIFTIFIDFHDLRTFVAIYALFPQFFFFAKIAFSATSHVFLHVCIIFDEDDNDHLPISQLWYDNEDHNNGRSDHDQLLLK